MTILDQIIEFFENKKTTIATIASAVLVYSLGRGYIAQDTAQLIADIMIAIGVGANIATAQYIKVKNERMIGKAVGEALTRCGYNAELNKPAGGNEAANQ
jgi:hypothetical protein